MNDTQLLPDDLAACQRLVVELRHASNAQGYALVEQARAVLEQSAEITKLKQVVEEQQLTINKLLQQAYRNRSERYREDPQQMRIDFGNTPEAGDAADGLTQAVQEAEIVIAEHTRRRHKPRKPREEALPADCYSGYQGITLRSEAQDRTRRVQRPCAEKDLRGPCERALVGQPLPGDLSRVVRHRGPRQDIAVRGAGGIARAEALPAWQRLRELLDGEAVGRVLPKEKFAEALGYLRNQWDALQVYLDDGRLPIDNNETEQLMKQVAIGRKNWLFVGSVAAGERAADLLSIVSSAVRNDLDVWAYVKEALDRLLAGDRDFAALRPDRWAAEHLQHIRDYRAEERRDRADARQMRRAHRRRAAPPAS